MTREEQRTAQIMEIASLRYEDCEKYSAFISGALWADNNPTKDIINLNNIWHDVSEEPKINEDVVLYDCCGNFITDFFDGSVTWRNIVLYYKATMWAYADDLLPKRDKK